MVVVLLLLLLLLLQSATNKSGTRSLVLTAARLTV